MITKQQALEFIDELSNSFSISIDLTKGIDCYLNVYSDSCGTFGVEGDFNSLEEVMTEFIKRFGNTALLEDLKCFIPVDVGMLEVGQTYRLGTGETLYLKDITEYKLIFTHTKNNIIFGIDKEDIKEIYKVNE